MAAALLGRGLTLLLSRPDIDGTDVIFEYGGDSWTVSVEDLLAQRLTFHPAHDLFVAWTPDGMHILFTSSRDEWKLNRYMLFHTKV